MRIYLSENGNVRIELRHQRLELSKEAFQALMLQASIGRSSLALKLMSRSSQQLKRASELSMGSSYV